MRLVRCLGVVVLVGAGCLRTPVVPVPSADASDLAGDSSAWTDLPVVTDAPDALDSEGVGADEGVLDPGDAWTPGDDGRDGTDVWDPGDQGVDAGDGPDASDADDAGDGTEPGDAEDAGDGADQGDAGDADDEVEPGDAADAADRTGPADAEDPGAPEVPGDAADADAGGDAGGDLPGTDAGEGCPGGPLCACSRALDCQGGYCLDTMEGAACAPLCTGGEACPSGWSCRVMQAFPEEVRACVAPALLCRPCRQDADCNGTGETGNLCLSEGPAGSTCGRACAGDADCPEGFACTEVTSLPPVLQCRPGNGAACPCTARFVSLGFETTCYHQNDFGRCEALRTCDQVCPAPVPAPESCGTGGEDEDCDGGTDEDGAAGCQEWYRDLDDDGYGTDALPSRCLCSADPWTDFTAQAGGDCADLDPLVSPGLPEDCATPRDDNCRDGDNDAGAAGCHDLWPDRDRDGFGGGDPLCLCRAEGEVGTAVGGDCDDADSGVQPGLEDVCNGRDDDCDGLTDRGFPDLDEDGTADCADDDRDGDDVKNAVDLCPDVSDPFQDNVDGDGEGDACDTDDDGDGVPDEADGCPTVADTDQADGDGDDQGDACDCDADADGVANPNPGCPDPDPADRCPRVSDPVQADLDGDGLGDACDPDRDGDGVPDLLDVCPADPDPLQEDLDRDRQGDACDPDDDGDGVADAGDLCPTVVDPGQKDLDLDGLGDACDPDRDGDGRLNGDDNCPGAPNEDQHDTDGNGVGDVCEGDIDGDGVPDELDVCLLVADPGQGDQEGDGIGDACDCDRDGDGIGNANPGCPDPDPVDVCPAAMDPGQEDRDGDGEGDACDPDRDGDGDPNTSDCAPDDPAVGHGTTEACNGGDDDCDGEIDEQDATGCTLWRIDADGDGYGATGSGRCLCGPTGSYTSPVTGDCDDRDATIHPGATERCNGRDDDCDGQLNQAGTQGCTAFFQDVDGDGHGAPGENRCLCAGQAPWTSSRSDDCDDGNRNVNPSQVESCTTAGVDDDCDGTSDEEGATACTPFYLDGDGDGRGTSTSRCLCAPVAPHTAILAGDCDDGNDAVGPQAAEKCATVGLDDDCDGNTDETDAEGCRSWFQDGDGDTYGTASRCLCAADGTWTATRGSDCNDNNPGVHPGATEACAPAGVDEDCDGATDGEGAAGCTTRYRDADGDGWGVPPSRCLCAAEGFHTTTSSPDCDDGDGGAHPGATEICGNTRDEDCDGQTDEPGCSGCVQYYRDEDGDTYGVVDPACLCQSGPSGTCRATRAGDCDDSRVAVSPGAAESCATVGVDDDCDSSTDEKDAAGCVTRWRDGDGDQYGVTGDGQCLCAPSGAYKAPIDGDCNDGNAAVHPGTAESCATAGVDDDCDGSTDEEDASSCTARFHDGDSDGYGVGSPRCLCASSGTWRAGQAGDCDDGAPAIHPGSPERCATATVDDDCDGVTDEENAQDCATWYYDSDGDTYGVAGNTKCMCAALGKHSAVVAGDCADTDALVHPQAPEPCNGKDDDCDSATDEEFPQKGTACDGADTDLCAEGTWQCNGTALTCSDSTGANPETCNGADEDCDGATDEDFPALNSPCSVGLGQCLRSGTTVCRADGSGTRCSATAGTPGTETCNGLDDDCNGGTDEPFTQKGQPCDGSDGDACLEGTWICDGVGLACNDATPTQVELCNDIDDDCDGATDEGFFGKGQACDGPDGDECREGTFQCDGTVLVCTDTTGSTVESCNDQDDDCDGTTDEGFPYKGQVCDGEDGDSCEEGRFVCDGIGLVCDDLTGTTEELCSTVGVDDDCNGQTDEDWTSDCTVWYPDQDGDTWGHPGALRCGCGPLDDFTATVAGDCDDGNADIHPGARAICGVDADCDGVLTEAAEECDDGNAVEWDGCYKCATVEFQVNTESAAGQSDAALAALDDARWVATWTTEDRQGAGTDILAQFFQEGGRKEGAPFLANPSATKGHAEADVDARADGSFAVAWASSVVVSSDWLTQVRMRRFDERGRPVDASHLEIGEEMGGQEEHQPVVVPAGTADWIAAWQTMIWEGPWVVKARRVLPAGVGPLISVSPEGASGDWMYPSVAPLADGAFVVALTGPYSVGTGVYLKGFNASGKEVFSRLVAGGADLYVSVPQVRTLSDGNLVVVWQSQHLVYGTLLSARRYQPDGDPIDPGEVLVTSTTGARSTPLVAPLADGEFVVAWTHGITAASDVRVTRMGGSPLAVIGKEFRANEFTTGSQAATAIRALRKDSNRYIVLWTSQDQDGSGLGVFGRRFEANGLGVWP